MTNPPSSAVAPERIASDVAYQGRFLTVRVDTFRRDDGMEVTRELVAHQGSVGVVCHDDYCVYLVRQPREVVGEPALLEIPAGVLDKPGENPLDAAKRELAEEIGKQAATWTPLRTIYNSPGCMEQREHLFLATDLTDVPVAPDAEERIEIFAWPLIYLDQMIDHVTDAKTLTGLLMLARIRAGVQAS